MNPSRSACLKKLNRPEVETIHRAQEAGLSKLYLLVDHPHTCLSCSGGLKRVGLANRETGFMLALTASVAYESVLGEHSCTSKALFDADIWRGDGLGAVGKVEELPGLKCSTQ